MTTDSRVGSESDPRPGDDSFSGPGGIGPDSKCSENGARCLDDRCRRVMVLRARPSSESGGSSYGPYGPATGNASIDDSIRKKVFFTAARSSRAKAARRTFKPVPNSLSDELRPGASDSDCWEFLKLHQWQITAT